MTGRQSTRTEKKRHEEAAGWVLRNREPSQTEGEKAAFDAWLARDPENARIYQAAERLMGEARAAIESDPALRDLKVKPRQVSRPIIRSVVALFLVGGLFVLFDGPMRLRADVIAGTGEMPVITLEDGSTVQLNASSAISHDYSGHRRIVKLLRGQAYFEVASDPERPFQVEAGDVLVTALGTAFDVRIGDTETDVTVTQHAVQIDIADGKNTSLRVNEGEQVSYDLQAHSSAVKETDSMLALAWRRGQLVLDNAPLSYLVAEMRSHFRGQIVIVGDELARRRVSGTLAITDTDAALTFLERSLGVKTNRIGPLILIRD
ncbi:iron dicitrate transport regulator FecR [Metarhizobium album]|uniref:Iron dicitrate transport regulator FecR n=1 Tax=Metarhizobium album TaxID=2182425 RepID=A0A2U2DGL0_9HYPH|nr:FecR family protein [Rhizobium album]PWE52465.1 iron dicitrate transport regulator FecR [Rhizobium album]